MPEFKILSHINTPDDLRQLKLEDLPTLCEELREDIIYECSHNPGHLASSLGTVELTVALHYVFATPDIRLMGTRFSPAAEKLFIPTASLAAFAPFPHPKKALMIPLLAAMLAIPSLRHSVWPLQLSKKARKTAIS